MYLGGKSPKYYIQNFKILVISMSVLNLLQNVQNVGTGSKKKSPFFMDGGKKLWRRFCDALYAPGTGSTIVVLHTFVCFNSTVEVVHVLKLVVVAVCS